MPRKKKEKETNLETIKNLSYAIIGLLLVVMSGLIVLFFEMN